MKHSISKQFAVIFIGMMVSTVAFCWLINTVFLEDYYVSEKQKNLVLVYQTLNDATKNGKIDTENFL